MRELRLIAVSEDGAHLILSGHDGEQLALRVDDRLLAAIRGDRARLGQLDIRLESQLRPRDIQARIRAGESVDSVAAVAGMPREKVERFAGPVLAEREHIAGRARQATVRRLGGDGPPQTLEAAAGATAKTHGADPDLVEWDAWRREDGRWLVRFAWAGEEEDSALFSFDPSGRTVVPEDDNARSIAGVLPAEAPADPEPAAPAGPARLSVVGGGAATKAPAEDDEGPDLPAFLKPAGVGPVRSLVRDLDHDDTAEQDDDEFENTTPIPAAAARRTNRRTTRTGRERRRREPDLFHDHAPEPAEPAAAPDDTADADDTATSERLRLSDIAQHVETEEESAADLAPTADEEPAPPARKTSSSRSRRPSVPSWDEIMFGRRKND
ncbi:septation protein SepH [Jiangella endophytica]|uniref:septation protein SepH n=1 Tax=Jiangella endophytica TaxID=1623398 RepID=UPI00130022CA|nr:septation protein SepH [Jiangella endophytica]